MTKGQTTNDMMTGDWIAHISFMLYDQVLLRLDGVYKDRPTALAAIGESIAKVDWGSILDVHGSDLSTEGKYLDNIRVNINVNARRSL